MVMADGPGRAVARRPCVGLAHKGATLSAYAVCEPPIAAAKTKAAAAADKAGMRMDRFASLGPVGP